MVYNGNTQAKKLMVRLRRWKEVEEEHVFKDLSTLRFFKREEVINYDDQELQKLLLDYCGIDIGLIWTNFVSPNHSNIEIFKDGMVKTITK